MSLKIEKKESSTNGRQGWIPNQNIAWTTADELAVDQNITHFFCTGLAGIASSRISCAQG